MNNSHSPGPWAHKSIAIYNPLESTDEFPRFDCSSYGGSEWVTKAKANTRLIVAAPEMFEVLELAESFVRRHYTKIDGASLLERIRNVISSATQELNEHTENKVRNCAV